MPSQYASLSLLPRDQKTFNGNCGTTDQNLSWAISGIGTHHRNHFKSQKDFSQPKLIHLRNSNSDSDVNASYIHYPILPGVTMLGTGKGCVKPPDILLQGSGVAPQHCFIERFDVVDEVILHPISELTTVDNLKIYGPTPLRSGNVISIGESHSFKYEGTTTQVTPQRNLMMNQYHHYQYNGNNQNFNHDHQSNDLISESETPYAIISPGPGPGNPSLCDVNRNSSRTMGLIEPPVVLTREILPRKPNGIPLVALPQRSRNGDEEEVTSSCKQFRDRLESEHFVSKVARFEYLTHQNHTSNGNTFNGNRNITYLTQRIPILPNVNGFPPQDQRQTQSQTSSGKNQQDNDSSGRLSYSNADYYETPNNYLLSSPSPYYNGYNRRTYYTHTSTSPTSASMPSNNYNNNKITSPMTKFDEDSSLSSNCTSLLTQSTPSPPDSLYSSHSSNNNTNISPTSPSYYRNGNGNCSINSNNNTETNTIKRNLGRSFSSSEQNGNANRDQQQLEREIACEFLLEMKRKQAEEARLAAEETERVEKLRLDEILTMCFEYEEQISREIQEKRSTPKMETNVEDQSQITDFSSLSSYSPGTYSLQGISTSGAPAFNRQGSGSIGDSQTKSFTSSSSNSNSFSSCGSHSYGRIKTNGSLPREKKATISNTQQSQSPVISTIHDSSPRNGTEQSPLFSNSEQSNQRSLSSNSSFVSPQNSFNDDVFTTPNLSPDVKNTNQSKVQISSPTDLRMLRSPYENVFLMQRNSSTSVQESSIPVYAQSMKSRIKTSPSLGISQTQNYNTSTSNESQMQRRPIITTVVEPKSIKSQTQTQIEKVEPRSETPPKSKLSVSFSNSVVEFHADDEKLPLSSPKLPVSNEQLAISGKLKLQPSHSFVRNVAAEVEVHVASHSQDICGRTESPSTWNSNYLSSVTSSPNIDMNVQTTNSHLNYAAPTCSQEVSPVKSKSLGGLVITSIYMGEDQMRLLKLEISQLEQQEMETIIEMEMEKALLIAEEKSVGSQFESERIEVEELKSSLTEMEMRLRRWRERSLDNIFEIKTKLRSSEKELQGLENIHFNFSGTTDEETVLLERIKGLHELLETERKAYEDAEFRHMEEEVDKEGEKDELSKTLGEAERKLTETNSVLEQLKTQNRVSLGSSSKEIQSLEKRRQEYIKELQRCQGSRPASENRNGTKENAENSSDSEDGRNVDLEEKLRNLFINTSATEGADHIEKIKSRSPIDSQMGAVGPRTYDTLRTIERNREYHLNEQGVQMLEEERKRVRELQKRVQDAVREEWEASRKSRSNQCQSLNSVGSEDSTQTISDTPTDSGSSDDTTDKSATQSFSTTDMSLNGNGNGENSFDLCQQMRQKQRDLSQAFEETRPLSDGSAYDNDSSIVTMREKHRVQNRPLTRYLPVRGDEDHFDLRAHIESSGHQLELCPQVLVTALTARGFLSKLGSRFHNWNKRWFVFDRETRTLSYYIDKSEKKPRGGIHFQAIEEVYVDHLQSVKSQNPKLTFCVKTYNRIYHLVAPSAEAMRIWIDIIFTGAEGYQEFKCVS